MSIVSQVEADVQARSPGGAQDPGTSSAIANSTGNSTDAGGMAPGAAAGVDASSGADAGGGTDADAGCNIVPTAGVEHGEAFGWSVPQNTPHFHAAEIWCKLIFACSP